jgi:hypothetical protein
MITQTLSALALLAVLAAPVLACDNERPAQTAMLQPVAAMDETASPAAGWVRNASVASLGTAEAAEEWADNQFEQSGGTALEIWWRRYQRALAHAE